MKTCAYCGQANDDTALVCAGCGTGEFKTTGEHPRKTAAFVPAFREFLADDVKVFRTLVLVSTVSYLLFLFGGWIFWRDISEETYSGLGWRGYGAILPIPYKIWWLISILWIATAIGMLTFSKQARVVYLALTLFGLVTALLGGMVAELAIENLFITLTYLTDGAVLALAYFSPLKERFT